MKKLFLGLALFLLWHFTYSQNVKNIGSQTSSNGPFVITGVVTDIESQERLVGVNVIVKETGQGTITETDGTYSLKVSKGSYKLVASYIGYQTVEITVNVLNNGSLNISLAQDLVQLNEVVIRSESLDRNIKSTDLGKDIISISSIKSIPPLAGEVDVLKSITLLPGVSTVGEASSGVNVRGGSADQNLILLGGAPLYNPSHLFGFFSSINSDVVEDLTLYKGGIPAKYGGRASSVVDISYKTGNLREWERNLSLGLVSSKIGLSGPIVKNKLAVTLSGRASYVNWLLNMVNNAEIKNSSASFYDLNGKLDYYINDNNQVSYSFYRSYDDFNLASDTANVWSNQSHVINVKHSFNEKFFFKVYLVDSRYNFSIVNDSGVSDFELYSEIVDQSGVLDFNYSFSPNNDLNFGFNSKLITINPGDLTPTSENSNVAEKKIEDEKAHESAAYFYHKIDLSKKFSLSYGIRYNYYRYLGPKTVSEYQDLLPRSDDNVTGVNYFEKNEVIEEYGEIAPRAALRFSITNTTSFKVGYSRMNQFIHLISNTSTLSPTNIWKLSDNYIKPQIVTQYSAGIFKNFKNNAIETSIEAYYKDIDNIVEYKDGAELLLSNNIETELLNGVGEAYGIELFFKKKTGRLNGWASYSYARSLRKVEGAFFENQINSGDWFPSNFDKPHDFTVVTNYKIKDNVSLSTIFTYNTGRPVTYPAGKFQYNGQEIAYFDSRNESRIPNYHRLDVALTWNFKSNKKIWSGDWTLSVYNLYGRKNAYSVFFDDVVGAPPRAYKLSILNAPFPSINYSVKF